MSHQRKFDHAFFSLLYGLDGGVPELLDGFFSFISRETDLFREATNEKEAENIILTAFRKIRAEINEKAEGNGEKQEPEGSGAALKRSAQKTAAEEFSGGVELAGNEETVQPKTKLAKVKAFGDSEGADSGVLSKSPSPDKNKQKSQQSLANPMVEVIENEKQRVEPDEGNPSSGEHDKMSEERDVLTASPRLGDALDKLERYEKHVVSGVFEVIQDVAKEKIYRLFPPAIRNCELSTMDYENFIFYLDGKFDNFDLISSWITFRHYIDDPQDYSPFKFRIIKSGIIGFFQELEKLYKKHSENIDLKDFPYSIPFTIKK